jgi:probable HAF family extracellular repeat protein
MDKSKPFFVDRHQAEFQSDKISVKQKRTGKSRKMSAILLCAGLASLLTFCEARAQTKYTFTELRGLRSHATYPVAINNGGEVVGTYYWSDNSLHSFIYRAGALHDLGTLSGYANHVTAINNYGQVVGYFDNGSIRRAYLHSSDGKVTDLGSLDNATYTMPLSINDCGVIVGVSATTYNNAFVYQNGHMSALGAYKGNPLIEATSINNRGQIVAWYQSAAGTRTILWSGGQMQEIDALGAAEQTGSAINDHGEIIGITNAALGPDNEQGFVYRGGHSRGLGFEFGPGAYF